MSYNWDAIFKDAASYVHLCSSINDLAKMMGIPRTTLQSAMNRRGITFGDLLVQSTVDAGSQIDKLVLQNRHLRREIKELKKQVGYQEWLGDVIEEVAASIQPISVDPPPKSPKPGEEQIAMLLISDVHMGQKTPAEEVGLLGEYNSEIAIARVRHTLTTFASIVKHQPFPVNTVYILFLGDNVEHSHLRPGHEGLVDMNVVKQTITFCDIITNGLIMLAGEFECVNVVAVPGNHGRVASDPRKCAPTDSFDYLCYEITKRLTANQVNVNWDIPESWYALTQIHGFNFLAMHGSDSIKSYVGFPWYGASRAARQYQSMFRLVQKREIRKGSPKTVEELMNYFIVPDYVLLAHFHTEASWQNIDAEIFANGAMPGVSRYAAQKRAAISRPTQKILFVHPRYGVGLRCPIYLDDIG